MSNIQFLPTISTSFIVISAVLVAIGWGLVVKGKVESHKKVMLAVGVSALIFFLIYASRTVFIGNTAFGGGDDLKPYYTFFLIFHIILATTGAVFGIVSIVSGLKTNLKLHRRIGPITSIIWFFVAITGVMVYVLLYVLFEPGETTSVIKAILGF